MDFVSNESLTTTIRIKSRTPPIKITKGMFEYDIIVGIGIKILENEATVVFVFII